MKKLLLFIAAAISMQVASVELTGQDLEHYKRIVKELISAKYQGRGYAEDGANKAGRWIAKEFAKAGADEVICQPFKLDINTFPGKMERRSSTTTRSMTTGKTPSSQTTNRYST